MAVGEILITLVVLTLALSVLAAGLMYAIPRARRRREMTRRRGELRSQAELDAYIARVDQVTSDDDLDHLANKKRD